MKIFKWWWKITSFIGGVFINYVVLGIAYFVMLAVVLEITRWIVAGIRILEGMF